MRRWKPAAIAIAIALIAWGRPSTAASLISTSTTSSAFDSASRFHVHFANGYFWVAFHNGTTPVLFSSRDGVSWASQGSIFSFNPAVGGMWTTRFLGTNVVALGFNSGNTTRYYRNGTLNGDGTVSWSAESVAQAGATATPINALIANQKPVYWRASAPGAGQLARGSALATPAWTNPPVAPTLAPTTGGRFWAGAVFQTGGANPEDLILIRATTQTPYLSGNHRLVSVRYDQISDSHDAAWYNVSTLGGGLGESATTEVKEAADDVAQLRFAAVRDTSGNIHAVFVNRSDDVVHYKKDSGFAGVWSRVSTDVIQTASVIDRVALTAAEAGNLFLFYSKSDNAIYYRRFNGTSWGGEGVLKAADANPLQGALAPMESANGCSIGLAWEQGSGSPFNVYFSFGVGSCSDLSASAGAGTFTVTAPASFEMRFNTATGGGIDRFFDLAIDPTRTFDLAGSTGSTVHEALMLDELVVGGTWYTNERVTPGFQKLDVLEVTPTRVRVRSESFYGDWPGANILPGLKLVSDSSIYPSGRAALRWNRVATANVNYTSDDHELTVHYKDPADPLSNWVAYGQGGGTLPPAQTPGNQDFALFQIEQAQVKTDFLLIRFQGWAAAERLDVVNTGAPDEEFQLFWRDTTATTINAGTTDVYNFLTYFKPTTFSSDADGAVTTRSSDYRLPDPLSAIGPGSGWNENTADADFFNESEAAYTLNLDPAAGLTFDMDGATRVRYSPFFKIRRWRSFTPPATITVEGVTKVRDIDFKADVKPVTRAAFAKDLLWHSTLQVASAVDTWPDIGSPGTSNGVSYTTARYGQGANVTADGQYVSFPITDGAGAYTGDLGAPEGAVEFWYRPSWNHDDGIQHDLAGSHIDANNRFVMQKLATNALRFRIAIAGTNYDCTVSSGNYSFRASDWVHLRFEWDDSPASGPEQRIVINRVAPTQTCPGDWTAPGSPPPNVEFRLGDIGDGAATFGAGLYDEVYSYGPSSTTPAALANGGLASSASEYLATGARNFQLDFVTRDAEFRGPRLFIGSDSKFLGLNIALAVKGVSADANLRIHYWNGMAWTILSDTDSAFWVPGFSDTSDSLRQDGTMSWPESLVPNWEPYSVNGGPDLYYIRIGQQYGTYTTPPTEAAIKTDILLFQYCTDVSAVETFAFGVPPPTAVTLSSFEARGLDGAIELSWQTASELSNLGFHLYRAPSPDGHYERITASVIPGLGSSPSGASYRYTDSGLTNGVTYYYKLEDIETTGTTTLHGPVEATPLAGGSPTEESGAPAAMIYGDPSSSSLRILASGPREIVLELVTEGFHAEPQADGSVRLAIPGFSDESVPGSPLLPAMRSWIGITGARTVQVASVREEDVERFSSLRPMAADSPELVASARIVRAGRGSRREGRAFRGSGLYPEAAARVLEIGFQGDEKKAKVELSPLRWNRSTGELTLARRLVVRLALVGREGKEHRETRVHSRRDVGVRLVTREPGLYSVRYEDVFFGVSRRRSGASLRLSRLGEAVPYHLEPDGQRFGPGTTLYFVSDGASLNAYGDEAVYELETSAEGVRMPVDARSPSGSTIAFYWQEVAREENRYYQAGLVDAEDLWLWDVLLAPVRKTFPFEVSALAANGESPRLLVRLQGTSDFSTSPDHHVRVEVNGTRVLDSTFEGKSAVALTADIPPGVIQEGVNEFSIENVGDTGAAYSMVMLDRFAVSYPRRLVAEDGTLEGSFPAPGVAEVEGLEGGAIALTMGADGASWLGTGTRFRVEAGRGYQIVSPQAVLRPEVRRVAGSGLTNPRNRADYLIVGPRELLPAARPLLELRRSQGLSSREVAIEEVYSEFGFGERRPEAIRDLLSYAYHHWQAPAPRYVLLLGDATYDFKDYLGTGVTNQVPPAMVRTSYLWTASDPSYAAVHGEDDLPDLAIGRLPAANVEQVRAMVAKILEYEATGALSQGPVVLVADNPDGAGNFEADAEELARGVLASRDPREVFLGRLGADGARSQIVDAFDEGASVMSYLGHGGIHLWASENIFDTSRVSELAPSPRQPFVLTLNCLNGYFHFPYFDSLAEALLKADGKGAVAAFSPSGLSRNEPAHLFHKTLLAEVLGGRHRRLGDAVLAAQAAYAESGAFSELLRIYHLLGDPALTLR